MSLNSESERARTTLNSDGCVTKYSGLMASMRVIFAITAGNCSWIAIGYWPVLRRAGGAFFGSVFPGNVGGSFDFRFSLGPNATCAFREGVGPRAVGFSFGRMIGRASL